MTNKIEMPKHADAFIDCGYSCEVGEVTAKAVFELLGSESAVMEAGSTSSYRFATREQGAAFYHAHKEDALIVNEKLAYLIWGKTLADAIDFQYKDDSIANSSQAQFIIDGKPTAEQVKNGVGVSVYSTLAGAMVQRVCEKYKEYVDENKTLLDCSKGLKCQPWLKSSNKLNVYELPAALEVGDFCDKMLKNRGIKNVAEMDINRNEYLHYQQWWAGEIPA